MAEPLFYRMKELPSVVGISRAEIYRCIKRGTFPAPYKLGARGSGWTPESLQAWRDGIVAKRQSPE
jgi:predicted DNA-binding transcriptional regulator AlpA